jgi:predicted signal transduction protein with EAL and GGDEF domain
VWTVHSIALLRDENGAPVSYVSQMQDNADAHRIREDLLARVNHDPLTGLINREQLQAHVTHLLTFPLPSPVALAVLFCDIDDFKMINDTYGHAVGDTVLCEAAHRMASALRLPDVAALTRAIAGGDVAGARRLLAQPSPAPWSACLHWLHPRLTRC